MRALGPLQWKKVDSFNRDRLIVFNVRVYTKGSVFMKSAVVLKHLLSVFKGILGYFFSAVISFLSDLWSIKVSTFFYIHMYVYGYDNHTHNMCILYVYTDVIDKTGFWVNSGHSSSYVCHSIKV